MKKTSYFLLALCLLLNTLTFAQKDKKNSKNEEAVALDTSILDMLRKVTNLKYQDKGDVTIASGKGSIAIPAGYKYLDPKQTKTVLEDIWGNPPRETDGMLFPEKMSPIDSAAWAFVITYDEDGHIEDADADKIDYTDMLATMKTETDEGSKERVKQGYRAIKLIGWASQPYYDKERKTLHWAKELEFDGNGTEHTLNYDVRVLGRAGVISLNAVGTMANVAEVKNSINGILTAVKFTDGNKYVDFNPGMDKVAAVGIGGLVAGKILAKVGFFAIFLKYIKIIGIAVVGAGGWLWKKMTGGGYADDKDVS
ncbi:MAG: hypothetical protein RLZZ292_1184 [Bacteroidota bacterium]|jgi:uncharacterized membrane-anchored protein